MIKNDVISAELNEEGRPLRQIRSFVRRQGRLTKGQQIALDECWSKMGIDFQSEILDLAAIFGRSAPLTLEIGFGMGKSLVEMAKANPDRNYLGIEVHLPGVGACLATANEASVKNLRVICHDAIEVLNCMLSDKSVNMLQLFFPDPWHKVRHHKRRIVQTGFTQQVRQKLEIGGQFHMATDWQPYAQHMLNVMNTQEGYKNCSMSNTYVPRPDSRPLTKFELRGHNLGHSVWDLMFERID